MKKLALITLLLVVFTQALYTSSFWDKEGINVRDQKFQQTYKNADIYVQTQCKLVDLSAAPFNHNGLVWSGYLNVNKRGSALGFIFYGKEGAKVDEIKTYPTIIWLNGGPGSSSQLGNFMELGPHFIKPANLAPYEVVKNNFTWIKDYNVIFVDQPVGTGLSFADPNHPNVYCQNMSDVANDFYYALTELYTKSEGCLNKVGITGNHPLFIFGESYAGKYAPAIAEKIKYEQLNNNGFLKNLRGVGIGDGFTNPYVILSQVGQYAYNLGLIDYQERSRVEKVIMNATYQERYRKMRDLHDSFDLALDYIVNKSGGVNVYDITKYKPYPTVLINSFLSTPNNIKKFQLIPELEFGSQNSNVYQGLYEDFMRQYVGIVETLLEQKVNVIIYNGQNDLIVQTPGTFKWTEMLHHEKAEEFRQTMLKPWRVNGKVAGFHKIVGNLQLRTVNDAGHLVPMDQGEWALEMVRSFVQRSL